MFKIAYYEMKKIMRDHRLLIVFLIQPMILIYILGNTLAHDPTNIKVTLFNKAVNSSSSALVEAVKKSDKLSVEEKGSESEAVDQVNNDKAKAGVVIDVDRSGVGSVQIIKNATIPELSSLAEGEILKNITPIISAYSAQGAVQKIAQTTGVTITNPNLFAQNISVETESNTTRKINFFDYYASAIIALMIMLVGLSASVTTISQERTDGTFERFFVTPYSKASMILGKMMAFIGVSLALALISFASLTLLFDVTIGAIWLVLLITFANGLAAIALGILISSATYSIAESIQVSSLIFFAILILTGLIFQPETMQPWVKAVHDALPFTYTISSMREVNILGFGFDKVWTNIVYLFVSAGVFLGAAVVVMRRRAQ